MKSLDLLSQLPKNPAEFLDRVSAIFNSRWESSFKGHPQYRTVGVEEGMELLQRAIGLGLGQVFDETALARIETQVSERQAALPADAPFGRFHNGDALLGRLCYAVSRALRPGIVAETGVCYGVTSAYLLAALDANRDGHLYSIDLPPLGKNGDDFVGWMVPNDLRSRWTLRRGTSRRLLGPLLEQVGHVDLFIHDSLHTYRNMAAEFEAAWPALRPGGILISDDIEGNEAFHELMRSGKPELSLVIQEKNKTALLGIAVKSR